MSAKTLNDEIQKHFSVCETYFSQEILSQQSLIAVLEEKAKLAKKIKELQTVQSTLHLSPDIDKV